MAPPPSYNQTLANDLRKLMEEPLEQAAQALADQSLATHASSDKKFPSDILADIEVLAKDGEEKALTGADLSAGFPNEFGQILDQARTSWDEGETTSRILEDLQQAMYQLIMRLGLSDVATPLDWSPGTRTYSRPIATEDAAPYSSPEDDGS